MGQKVNPHGIRLGIVKSWDAKWYADKDFAQNLHEDINIRNELKKQLFLSGVSRIETERSKNRLKLTIENIFTKIFSIFNFDKRNCNKSK